MPVLCAKIIPLSIFWFWWDVLVPLPYLPRLSRKMKVSRGVQKIIFWVTAPRMCLWLLGELQTPKHPMLNWESLLFGIFFGPKLIFSNIKAEHLIFLKRERGRLFCTHNFPCTKRTEGAHSGFWCWLSTLCPVQWFCSLALTCSISPEDVPVGLLMYKIWWTSLIDWIPFSAGLSATPCRREVEALAHQVPLTSLLSFAHLRPASKGCIHLPLPCGFWWLSFSTKQSFGFYAVVPMRMYYLSQCPLIELLFLRNAAQRQ